MGELSDSFEYGLNAAATEYDGENKYIRITDIDDVSRRFVETDLTSPQIDLSNAGNYKLKIGDILFARTGASVGKSYIYNESDGLVYYAGFLIRTRIKPEYDAEFVFQSTLTSKYNDYIRINSQRSGQPGVNAQEYAEFYSTSSIIWRRRRDRFLLLRKAMLLEMVANMALFEKINKRMTYNNELNYKDETPKLWLFPLALVFVVLLFLIMLECKYPYYFLQDDNRDYFLPYYIHNYESLQFGQIAVYNFHQFLGTPSLSVGQSAALYPITYLSVFMSKLFLGHYFAAIDIQVIIHLMIGALGMFFFIKSFRVESGIAFFAGLTWSMGSFIIFASNSWVVVSSVAAYFPWMLLLTFRSYKSPSLMSTLVCIVPRLLLFYSGHIQYFIYSVIFEFVTVLFFVASDSGKGHRLTNLRRYLFEYIKGYSLVFVISLPLLMPMWSQTTMSAFRSAQIPFGTFVDRYYPIDQLAKGLFFPFTNVTENTFSGDMNLVNLSHVGYITVVLVIVGIVGRYFLRNKEIANASVSISVFAYPAILAFLWSTNWIFNYGIYLIPILNRLRWPFKISLFLDFYLIVIAALIFASILHRFKGKRSIHNTIILGVILLQILNFSILYIGTPYRDFGEHHADEIPLEEPLVQELSTGRIVSVGFDIWKLTDQNNYQYYTAPTLGFNYATLWGLNAIGGYEPLISKENDKAALGMNFTSIFDGNKALPISYFRKAGVKWYIVPLEKSTDYETKLASYGIIKKYVDKHRVIFYDSDAFPMVYIAGDSQKTEKEYEVTTNRINLNISEKKTETLTFNFLFNKNFVGYIDGEKILISKCDDIHFCVSVPPGNHTIMIKYEDPWFRYGWFISIASVCIIFGLFWMGYRRKSKPSKSN